VGKPTHWTSTARDAARELIAETAATEEDQAKLSESLDDLMSETPRTALAVSRFKKFFAGAGKEAVSSFS
jgi:hypothetical protein